ncbi:hypothetical protein RFI_28685 [Reticulomyxa filosa]|uniref:Uncharacterized protein n=1 Tax=Reticulomyxa filosa TaxID=46433 RepID=X6M3Z6_RETFI|nr:hypothetical protein RFI_28685 [Reticulomyxa filosa]|eukprot:ETO08703.1 hypothetical protein RFI_28685 [Reticulomyxa filosa]
MTKLGTLSKMKEDSLSSSSSRSKHLITDSLSTLLQKKSRCNSLMHLEIRKSSLMEQESLLEKILQGDNISDNDPICFYFFANSLLLTFLCKYFDNEFSHLQAFCCSLYYDINDLGMLSIKLPLGDMKFESRFKIIKKEYFVFEKAFSKCIALLFNLKEGPNYLVLIILCGDFCQEFNKLTITFHTFKKNPTILSFFINSLKKTNLKNSRD